MNEENNEMQMPSGEMPFDTPQQEFQEPLTDGQLQGEPQIPGQEQPTGDEEQQEPEMQNPQPEQPKEVEGGQVKCPKCGATDISQNMKTGKLRCNFCRHEFEPEKAQGLAEDASKLEGKSVSSGAADIDASADTMITLKCTSCGAEVVIDTTSSTQARCHWCRNMLSINNQIPNGAVPDMILPFKLKKDEAKDLIYKFVKARNFYAHPTFKKEVTLDKVKGVYFPYVSVDAKQHVQLEGEGEVKIREYEEGSEKNKTKYYDAQCYSVSREFDIAISGLTVESSKQRLNNKASDQTNNIINSIMPFDTENCVKYDSNYLNGYTSEKRDLNVSEVKPIVQEQLNDISRIAVVPTLKAFDRGVRWESEKYDLQGENWNAAYLPVWLYSYMQKKSNGKHLLHYVAVNARTQETMGSVPLNKVLLFFMSLLVEILGIVAAFLCSIYFDSGDEEGGGWGWLFVFSGFIYYAYIYNRYRNKSARHYHEKETKRDMSNLQAIDLKTTIKRRLRNSKIEGSNYNDVRGSTV